MKRCSAKRNRQHPSTELADDLAQRSFSGASCFPLEKLKLQSHVLAQGGFNERCGNSLLPTDKGKSEGK